VGPAHQRKKKGERRGIGLLSSGPGRELGRAGKRGGEKKNRPRRRGKKTGPSPRAVREINSFPFYFLFPFSFKTKHISKPHLNSF